MTRNQAELALAQAALRVRGGRPDDWADLLKALDSLSATVRDQLLTTPLPDLPVIKGQAMACQLVLGVLRDAPRIVEDARTRTPRPR